MCKSGTMGRELCPRSRVQDQEAPSCPEALTLHLTLGECYWHLVLFKLRDVML